MSLGVPVALLALWEIASRLALVSPRYFPAPTTVAWVLGDRLVEGDLGAQALVTLTRLAGAFALAAVPGVLLGLLMGVARPVRAAVEPYIAFIFPVPKITLLPFLLIILGVGEPAFVLTGATRRSSRSSSARSAGCRHWIRVCWRSAATTGPTAHGSSGR